MHDMQICSARLACNAAGGFKFCLLSTWGRRQKLLHGTQSDHESDPQVRMGTVFGPILIVASDCWRVEA